MSDRCANETEGGARHLPPMPGEAFCFSCSPNKAMERRERASAAAKASHARRADPAVAAWSDSMRWEKPEDVMATMREAVVLVAKGALSTAQGQTIRQLADSWTKAYVARQREKPAEAAPPTIHITRYSEESVNHD